MPKVLWSLCQQPVEARTLFSAQKLELPLFDLIKKDRPEWPGIRGICTSCHDQYRAKKLLSYLEAEYDKTSEMEGRRHEDRPARAGHAPGRLRNTKRA
jgi:hypothetical protein